MLNKISFLLCMALLGSWAMQAQTFSDALRYSNFQIGGTARSMGAGSAMGALGSDFSVLSTNPAGLAWYRGSRFVASPTFFNARTESTLLNGDDNPTIEQNSSNFNFNSFGLIIASPARNGDWKAINVGIGLNRLGNFNEDFFFEGTSQGSIVNRFQDQANGPNGISDFESGLAIDVGALYDLEPQDGLYESDFELAPDAPVFRSQEVISQGAINELVFSVAGNYKERLMVGATIGVPFFRYEVNKTYREEDRGEGLDGNVPFFNALSYNEQILTTGTGVNLKLGMVVRASQAVRIGAAVHTPTAVRLNDDFTASMGYSFTDNNGTQDFDAESPEGSFNYRLRTPWRFIGSAGFIIQKSGFLSIEVEQVNFGNNTFEYDGFSGAEREVNTAINNELSSSWNLRLGGEYAYEAFRFRAGYGLQQSPLVGDDTFNSTISGGVGIRGKSYFVDLAYRRWSRETLYTPYLPALENQEQIVDIQSNLGQLVATVGFIF